MGKKAPWIKYFIHGRHHRRITAASQTIKAGKKTAGWFGVFDVSGGWRGPTEKGWGDGGR
jgi:hypothetical protein